MSILLIACLVIQQTASAEPLRIMPLGDSITAGYVDNYSWKTPFTFGYRGRLHTLLTRAGYDFQFVGESSEPFDGQLGVPKIVTVPDLRPLGQNRHRGYGGSVIGNLIQGMPKTNGGLAAWLKADQPDIVLLMIGINDIAHFGNVGEPVPAEQNLQHLVQTIVDTVPAAHVIVAQIAPYQTGQNTDSVQRYNAFIKKTLVPLFVNQGRSVHTVDQYANFLTANGKVDKSLYANIAHPNQTGYARMAKTWFQAIQAVVPPSNSTRRHDEKGTADTRLPCDLNSKIDPRGVPWTRGTWQKHGVIRLDGPTKGRTLPAEMFFIGGVWGYNNSQMPYLAYMPERKRLLLAASVDKPNTKAVKVFSSDFGRTWTKPVWMHTNAAGDPDLGGAIQLTYLGDGKLVMGDSNRYWFSADFGETWCDYAPVPRGFDAKPMWNWDPMFAVCDSKSGKLVQVIESRYKENGEFGTAKYFSQACVRFSADQCKTWTREIDVPEWRGVSEVVLCRAKNGDFVAACRTDNPPAYLVGYDDQYSGLATSISKDGGKTWSALNRLFAWGRHQPHMVVMPTGDIVMTYVVRNGYLPDKNGLSQFGVEAVVSTDNGATWNLDRKYILASNSSIMNGERNSWGSPQSTSNVLLPDGTLLTAFGTGVRNVPSQTLWLMDLVLLKWRPDSQTGKTDPSLLVPPYNSDQRNKFNLNAVTLQTSADGATNRR
jgi:lysophospholipase L1-like esterase